MFTDKKIRKYTERKLSEYSGAEDSLARLKKEQEVLPEKKEEKARDKSILKKAVLSFSVAAVVIITVCLIWVNAPALNKASLTDKQSSYDGLAGNGAAAPSGYGKDAQTNHSAGQSESAYAAEDAGAADINASTLYLNVVLPEGSTIEENGNGYAFSVTVGNVLIQANVEFGGADVSVSTDREAAVAGQTLFYRIEGGVLIGKIETDRECVYITRCEGASEEACLAAVRSIFIEK